MKVWVVSRGTDTIEFIGDIIRVDGVFSTEEKARSWVDRQDFPESWEIEDFEMDAPRGDEVTVA